jgi:hypothetical protein
MKVYVECFDREEVKLKKQDNQQLEYQIEHTGENPPQLGNSLLESEDKVKAVFPEIAIDETQRAKPIKGQVKIY